METEETKTAETSEAFKELKSRTYRAVDFLSPVETRERLKADHPDTFPNLLLDWMDMSGRYLSLMDSPEEISELLQVVQRIEQYMPLDYVGQYAAKQEANSQASEEDTSSPSLP